MPRYDFQCPSCARVIEISHSIHENHPEVRCPSCNELMDQLFSKMTFTLKGWNGWSSKNIREQAVREKRNAKLDQSKQERLQDAPKLVPNVEGKRLDSWEEAKTMAASKGYDATSYDPIIKASKSQ